jgi:protoporphyrinogen oxidase
VSASSPLAIIKRLVKSSTPAGRTFLYPRKGYGQIVEAIANAVTDGGGTIHLDSPVTGIKSESNICQILVGEKSQTVEHVWATAPLTKLTEIIQPKPDKSVLSAASSLRVRGMVLAYLVLDQEQYTQYDAHYLPSQETRIARLSEPKNYRNGDDPGDFTILCAEIPCWVNDDVWGSSDEKIGEIVIADIEKLGLPKPRYVETHTKRLPSVYPVFERDTMNDRETLLTWGESLGRVVPFGRQGFLVPDNLHHTLGMGWDLAESIGGQGEVDRVQWQSSINSFKKHIVED